jgi:thioredoxin 1
MSTDIKTSEWDSLISGKKLVAADFWAPWCPYCMRLKPVFDSIAKDYEEKIRFVKLNLDEEPEIASRYGIRGIPVIKFFCEGKEVGEIVGYLLQEALKREIENISRNVPNCLANTSLRK